MENKIPLDWKRRIQRMQDVIFEFPDGAAKAILLEESIRLWRTFKNITEGSKS